MQTDPIGYGDGINWYAYCGNNPAGRADPSGLPATTWYWNHRFLPSDGSKLIFQYLNDSYMLAQKKFKSFGNWQTWAYGHFAGKYDQMAGYELSDWDPAVKDNDENVYNSLLFFWELQKISFLSREVGSTIAAIENQMNLTGEIVTINFTTSGLDSWDYGSNTLSYNYQHRGTVNIYPKAEEQQNWFNIPSMVKLAHELSHCLIDLYGIESQGLSPAAFTFKTEMNAMVLENCLRYDLYTRAGQSVWPRPGYMASVKDISDDVDKAWKLWKVALKWTE
jgi:hypothetical protein